MSLHTEIKFEDEICDHLSANGWLYADNEWPATIAGSLGLLPTRC